MNLIKKIKSRSRFHTNEQSVITSVFSYAGFSFLSICAIGLAVWGILGGIGLLDILGDRRFDWNIYRQIASQNPGALKTLGFLSIIGIILLLLSWILRIIWIFRYDRVSKPFIYTVYTAFIIGQGVGFGFLFATWNAPDLLAIFGISGGLFAIMAVAGYFSKNLRGMLPFMIIGIIAVFFLMIINTILLLSGVYSSQINFWILTLMTVLSLMYIMFDLWWIKRTNEAFNRAAFVDKDDRFRIVAFLAFQLLTDFIWLFWNIVRMYARIKN